LDSTIPSAPILAASGVLDDENALEHHRQNRVRAAASTASPVIGGWALSGEPANSKGTSPPRPAMSTTRPLLHGFGLIKAKADAHCSARPQDLFDLVFPARAELGSVVSPAGISDCPVVASHCRTPLSPQ
jgi:hypothetical protein